MSKVRRIFSHFFFISLICFSFISCSSGGNGEPDVEPGPEINIDSSIISNGLTFSSEGGEKTISVSFNADWTLAVSDNTDWCSVSPTSGSKGNKTINIRVSENTNSKNRSTSVVVRSGLISKTFTVFQESKEEDKIEMEKTSFDIPTKGETISLSFKSNAAWTASSNKSWCSLLTTFGEKGKADLDVTIEDNQESEDRNAIITIVAGTATKEVYIQQFRLETIILEKMLYEINAQDGDFDILVESNTDYIVGITESWLKLKKQDKENLTFSIEKNNQKQVREAVVKLTGKYIEVIFTIRQLGIEDKTEGIGHDFIKG